jgi:hypothetical protein
VSQYEIDLQAVLEELSYERRALVYQEHAEYDGRVVNRPQWIAAMARRRERIRELEEQRDELLALKDEDRRWAA